MIRGLLARRRGMRLPLVHKVEVVKEKKNKSEGESDL